MRSQSSSEENTELKIIATVGALNVKAAISSKPKSYLLVKKANDEISKALHTEQQNMQFIK